MFEDCTLEDIQGEEHVRADSERLISYLHSFLEHVQLRHWQHVKVCVLGNRIHSTKRVVRPGNDWTSDAG